MSFLDLPNELLRDTFEYLTPAHLLMAFAGLGSEKPERLMQSCLWRLDISRETIEWIDKYLLYALTQCRIIGLRLQDKQMSAVSKYLSSGDVQSMEVISLDSNDPISEKDLTPFRGCVKKLDIQIRCSMKRTITRNGYCPRTVQMTYFSYSGRLFQSHVPWPHLTHLSIDLDTIHDIFHLLNCLSNLEDLKVHLHYPTSRDEQVDVVDVESPKTLRHVTLIGTSAYSSAFQNFFAVVGTTIQSLTLNIDFKSGQLTGSMLEHDLLSRMPHLSSLHLTLHWRLLLYHQPIAFNGIDITQFQTSAWEIFNPIVCWWDESIGHYQLCTLPYENPHFRIYSNKFLASCTTNRPVSLCFEQVRSVSMISEQPEWTMETFQFIQTIFPNLKTVFMSSELPEVERDRYLTSSSHKFPEIFQKDFRCDTIIQLRSVTNLSVAMEPEQYTKDTLRCLFCLLPNLITIETNDFAFARHYTKANGHFIDSILNQSNLSSHIIRTDPILIDYRIISTNLEL